MRAESGRKKLASLAARLSLLAAAALCASFLTCFAARAFVFGRTMKLQMEAADIVSERQPGVFHARSRNDATLKMNFAAFGVPDSNPAAQNPVAVPAPSANIRDFRLIGTLPSVGAWIEFKNGIFLMLKGHEREGYTLEEITPEYAVFTRGAGKFTMYLTYWSPSGSRVANVPPPRRTRREPVSAPQPKPPAAAAEDSGVIAAEANGEDGTISRELLNELLVNPLSEVGKMRLVPTDNGMMIEGMRSDSLFLKLGMKPNDVITNVNGIGINDVGNVSNVISSMLSGTRLDFQIEREGEPVTLGYAVK
ncbi:MAG: PDZ domain-containing protein [Synergistaceae bacterium]|jgi:type II secretory pathway component PulC|nr:PDZ domain-containing protein [Synergistaceae bacterium]